MTDLNINPVFQDITCTFKDQMFSAMYFGRNCGKNLLILQHDLKIMLLFGDGIQWSAPELTEPISAKGIQIVGNDDVILLLDEKGNLWRLINTFDISVGRNVCLRPLEDNCFYEWVLFKEFNCLKVLALTEFEKGFACIGLSQDSTRKLAVLPSMKSHLEDYTFKELNMTNSLSFYLLNLNINTQHSVFKNKLSPGEEILLVSDRLNGRTYLCSKNGKFCLVNQSNIFLISAMHFIKEKCLMLSFENGKLLFYFYSEFQSNCAVYLMRKISFVEKCYCFDSCLLWSDGVNLFHTKLNFDLNNRQVKSTDLKLNCNIENPLSLLRTDRFGIIVTANNIYYLISSGETFAVEIKKKSKELLSRISECSSNIDELEQKIDRLSHYLYCKYLVQNNEGNEKLDMNCEENRLLIKSSLGLCLREEFWKVRLKTSEMGKNFVHMIDLKCDLSEGMFTSNENPFKDKKTVKVDFMGFFEKEVLFFDLGEILESNSHFKKNCLTKNLQKIFNKRSQNHK